MITIKELLSRIRWDPLFGRGRFVIGYEDHVGRRIIRVPFSDIRIAEGEHSSFSLLDDRGIERTIPYHRVREVSRDGETIWHREP